MFLPVGNDVRCIEQRLMAEPAHRALFLIGGKDREAKAILVKPLLHHAGGVLLQSDIDKWARICCDDVSPGSVSDELEGEIVAD